MNFFDYFSNKNPFKKDKSEPNKEIEGKDAHKEQQKPESKNNSPYQVQINDHTLERVYNENIENGRFVVPKDVTRIHMYAFSRCTDLHTLILHENVRFIAPYAFFECVNLSRVEGLSDNVDMKNFGGFAGCKNLKDIDVPSSVQLVADNAFSGCENLPKISLPDGCWSIGDFAFSDCKGVHVCVPSSMQIIRSTAFKNCKDAVVEFLPQETVRDTMNVEINGKDLAFPMGDIILEKGCLNDVSIVQIHDDVVSTAAIIKSGYRGVLNILDSESQKGYTIDLKTISKLQDEHSM